MLPDFSYINNCLHCPFLAVPVDVDGLRRRAPHSETLLDDLLDFREVRLQGLVAEHFGKHLERQRNEQITSVSNAECNSAQLLEKCKSKQRTNVHRLYVVIPSVNPD